MRRKRLVTWCMAMAILLSGSPLMMSCGSMHSYWGVENEYCSDGHHHHKPHKHKKHKKHHRHHHD